MYTPEWATESGSQEGRKTMAEKTGNSRMNQVHTPLHSNCRLCHIAGFSNLCTFSHGGECPYVSMRTALAREVTRPS
jgi:hypothetical protein